MAPFLSALCSKRIIKSMNHQPGREIEQKKNGKAPVEGKDGSVWCAVVHVPDSAVFPEPSSPQRMLLAAGCTWYSAHPSALGTCSCPLQQQEPFPLWSLPAALPSWSCRCQQTWGKNKHRESVLHSLNERNETKAGSEHSLQYTCLKGKAECRARLTTSPQHPSLDCNKENRNIWI